MEKVTAIYARRSVASEKSLSIAAQIEECKKTLEEGEQCKIYIDNGKSGKDIQHRPQFQQMMQDIRDGLISRVVVKKYDRFSRSLVDFVNVLREFNERGITVFSMAEPFNNETKEGRMMLNFLMSFAEFERETIASRIKDGYAYKARETGFYQSGTDALGYTPKREIIDGRNGLVLFPDGESEIVRRAFEIYAQKGTSYRDVFEILKAERMCDYMYTSTTKGIFRNPLYVRADTEVYKYLAAKGVEMFDDIKAYDGKHGVFLHSKRSETPFAKVGYHEGIIDSETWLAVQYKLDDHKHYPKTRKAKNSWLVGLVKCEYCKKAIVFKICKSKNRRTEHRYLIDSGYITLQKCVKKTLKTRPEDVETEVFARMQERIKRLEISKKKRAKPDTETEKAKAEIVRIDEEISGLIDKLPKANDVLVEHINKRVATLTDRRNELNRELLTRERKSREVDTTPLLEPLNRWNELSVQKKHDVASAMIEVIYISDENGIDIKFSV